MNALVLTLESKFAKANANAKVNDYLCGPKQ